MKTTLIALGVTALFSACGERPKPPETSEVPASVAEIPSPRESEVAPPVNVQPFEDGYAEGAKAGEAAVISRPREPRAPKPKAPGDDAIAVIALEAAGADASRGPQWQRGFVSGYRDGFERVNAGKK